MNFLKSSEQSFMKSNDHEPITTQLTALITR